MHGHWCQRWSPRPRPALGASCRSLLTLLPQPCVLLHLFLYTPTMWPTWPLSTHTHTHTHTRPRHTCTQVRPGLADPDAQHRQADGDEPRVCQGVLPAGRVRVRTLLAAPLPLCKPQWGFIRLCVLDRRYAGTRSEPLRVILRYTQSQGKHLWPPCLPSCCCAAQGRRATAS